MVISESPMPSPRNMITFLALPPLIDCLTSCVRSPVFACATVVATSAHPAMAAVAIATLRRFLICPPCECSCPHGRRWLTRGRVTAEVQHGEVNGERGSGDAPMAAGGPLTERSRQDQVLVA